MRKDTVWSNYNSNYIQTTNPTGYDVLINGLNHYLNFNTLSGVSGYGFRDNNGTMEFKNSGGSWTAIGSGGGGSATWGSITGTLSSQTDLQTALNALVPYTGATSNVNLGAKSLTATGITNSALTTNNGVLTNTSSGVLGSSSAMTFDGTFLGVGGGTYFGGTNGIEISKAGAQSWFAMRNNLSSGNSGIFVYDGNNTSTSLRFQLFGTTSGGSNLQSPNAAALFTTNSANLGLGTYTGTGVVNFYTNQTFAGTIDANQRFGIGTTSPTAPLTVQANSVASTAETIAHFTVSDRTSNYLDIYNNTGTDGQFDPAFGGYNTTSTRIPLSFAGVAPSSADTGTTPLVVFESYLGTSPETLSSSAVVNRHLFSFANNGTSVMEILANGNVGIGTTSPSTKLQISGTDTQTSGTGAVGLTITPTYNQVSATTANTDLLINRTETAVGSGAQNLIDAQVGGSSKFSVSNSGIAKVAGGYSMGGYRLTQHGSSTWFTNDAVNLFTDIAAGNLILNGSLSVGSGDVVASGFKSGNARLYQGSDLLGGGWFVTYNSMFAPIYASGVELTGLTTAGIVTNTSSGVLGTTQYLSVANGGTGLSSLTSNYLYKGNGTSSMSQSLIYDNGTNVGIGTTSPAAKLDIADTALAGSGSLAGSALNIAQTWNTTGTPTAIKLNVTNTASNAASLLMDLQVGGVSQFALDKSGNISLPGSLNLVYGVASPVIQIYNTDRQIGSGGAGNIAFKATTLSMNGSLLVSDGNSRLVVTPTSADTTHYSLKVGTITNSFSTLAIRGDGNIGMGTATPASKLHVAYSPTATSTYGTISLGGGAFDGVTAGFFAGNASGTSLAVNEVSGYGGNLADLQVAGVSKFKVSNAGVVSSISGLLSSPTNTSTSIVTIDGTQTITNKRNQPRIVSAASYTTDTGTSLDFSTCDLFIITAQAGALKFNNPSGSPVQGEKMIIRIKDNGTARALTYDTQYRAIGVTLPTTTVISKTLYIAGFWNATDTKFDVTAVGQEA